MKKFISMVMAAAMVVSLVPATAFAAGTVTGTVSVVEAREEAENFGDKTAADMSGAEKVGFVNAKKAPEVQFEVATVDASKTEGTFEVDIEVTIDGAEFAGSNGNSVKDQTWLANALLGLISVNGARVDLATGVITNPSTTKAVTVALDLDDSDETTAVYTLTGASDALKEDDVIAIDLQVIMDDADEGEVATVKVESDIADLEETAFVEVLEYGLKATCKEAAEVAVEETTFMKKDIKIETVVGTFKAGQELELKLSKGFEFVSINKDSTATTYSYKANSIDENEAVIVSATNGDTIIIDSTELEIEAVDAKAGDVCVLTIEAQDNVTDALEAETEVEIAVVVADEVLVSVEDDDVPVIYSGVDVANTGITDDSKHLSLEVTVEESVADAWDFKQAFEMTLPEGVFVTEVKVNEIKNIVETYGDDAAGKELTGTAGKTKVAAAFAKAYSKGDQQNFEFGRKSLDAVDGKKAEMTFQLELVAEPTFVGDVVLGVAGQEVVIATFVAPYTVEAAQNDLIIDYRNTEVPTEIVITEAEAGLWAAGTEFFFGMENYIDFEGDPEVVVDEASEMEIDVDGMSFMVEEESDDEAAVVTISGIELYMSRDLAAGAYDLDLSTTMLSAWEDKNDNNTCDVGEAVGYLNEGVVNIGDKDDETVVGGLTDVDTTYDKDDAMYTGWVTAKEGFVNVVTAGRDADDASFTTKVVVPVGAMEIVSGESTVALDVPAYINAAGYTMLPVRAVAVALGIHTNNVIWDQATKTVTILYGQRIITMQVGSKVINVNGSAIPASAAVEIVDGRTFLGLRDLATALGVVDITWDAATQTATLNGNK